MAVIQVTMEEELHDEPKVESEIEVVDARPKVESDFVFIYWEQ